MLKLATFIGAAALAALAGGCADYGYNGGGVDVAYYGPAAVGFDGYYDDAYGPFFDGYWADDGFYYRTNDHDQYHRDTGGHFRHDAAAGFHAVQGHAPAHVRAAPPEQSRPG